MRLEAAEQRKKNFMIALDKAKDDYDEAEERRKTSIRMNMVKAAEEKKIKDAKAKGRKRNEPETPIELPPEIEKPDYQEMLKGVKDATLEIS